MLMAVFKTLLLLEAFLRVSPDEQDDLAGDELREAAKERRNPGDCFPLVRGGPHVPADQVVRQEWHKHHCSPVIVCSVYCLISVARFVVTSLSLFKFCPIAVHFITVGITWAFSGVESGHKGEIRVNVQRRQSNVEEGKDNGFFHILSSLAQWLTCGEE